jgi:hypothetical protein
MGCEQSEGKTALRACRGRCLNHRRGGHDAATRNTLTSKSENDDDDECSEVRQARERA